MRSTSLFITLLMSHRTSHPGHLTLFKRRQDGSCSITTSLSTCIFASCNARERPSIPAKKSNTSVTCGSFKFSSGSSSNFSSTIWTSLMPWAVSFPPYTMRPPPSLASEAVTTSLILALRSVTRSGWLSFNGLLVERHHRTSITDLFPKVVQGPKHGSSELHGVDFSANKHLERFAWNLLLAQNPKP